MRGLPRMRTRMAQANGAARVVREARNGVVQVTCGVQNGVPVYQNTI